MNLYSHQCVQNANVPLTCHRMTVVEQFAFHVTGQRPKERSISERDSVKICAIVGCSLASTFLENRVAAVIAFADMSQRYHGELFADRSSTANTCSSCVKNVNDCHADRFLVSHGKLNIPRQMGWTSFCVESHYVSREAFMKDPPDTLIISRYLIVRRVKPLIPEYYIKKSSTHTRTR
ncbi:hypothetical protein ALC56_00994 [Trachymyrmex septentrionalis]|uniref:Uncharacterized protein n=1 Tax=Trachymyrmex septentrionalis TaxID=34720 RepID=A0A195FVV0_9HYME|nr:hypothetical protein ALC56_00994 [Trachymyrmex septentrionalis]